VDTPTRHLSIPRSTPLRSHYLFTHRSPLILLLCVGCRDPKLCVPAELMIKGDTRIRCIAAASILAKVTRDRLMVRKFEANTCTNTWTGGGNRVWPLH
jgi:hypothetical protein